MNKMDYLDSIYSDFFGDNIEGVIYVNEDNANKYILKPFIDNVEGLIFTVEDDGRITFETTSTGYDHPSYGDDGLYLSALSAHSEPHRNSQN